MSGPVLEIKEIIYKTAGGFKLPLKIYRDKTWRSKKPAAVFFFGGGWSFGSIDHFKLQSEFLVSKGFVCVTPEYRVHTRHGVSPVECLEDAKDSLGFIRNHADGFGIDADKIICGGGSAGGHLAACTALIKNPAYDKHEIYKIPKGLLLFNPALDVTAPNIRNAFPGESSKDLSPMLHITENLPPTVIFQGEEDTITPTSAALEFCEKMTACGNKCEVHIYPGQNHGFFNPNPPENPDHFYFKDTIEKAYGFISRM